MEEQFDKSTNDKETANSALNKLGAEAAQALENVGQTSPMARPVDKPVNYRIENNYETVLDEQITEKEREEGLKKVSNSLTEMVTGELTALRDQMQKHKLSTKEVDELIAKKRAEAEAAKPLQQALLRGDIKAVQKLVAETDPEQLKNTVALVQKHAEYMGLKTVVEYVDGKLIVSKGDGNRAVLISKEKLDVIGINSDGSYDFSKHFRGENPGRELAQIADTALARALNKYLYIPFKRPEPWHQPPISDSMGEHGYEMSTMAVGEEGSSPRPWDSKPWEGATTMAVGEEGGSSKRSWQDVVPQADSTKRTLGR